MESSKLRMVSLHLTGIASAWWEAQTQDGTAPKHWKGFKKAFFKQFKSHVMNAWDSLHMEVGESVDDYNQKFWDYYLQVLPFRKISRKTQMEKYKAGLTPKIHTQVNTQRIKGIQNLMHFATVDSLMYMQDDVTASKNATKKEA